MGGAHTKGIVFTQYLWCGQNRMRGVFRAWLGDLGTGYPIRPLKFECDCFYTQNAFWGSGTARHLRFGPNSTRPAQNWPYACVPDPNRLEPSREGRASVCVTGPLSAASARYLRIGNSDYALGYLVINHPPAASSFRLLKP